jgi:hypothetical protein
MKTPGRSTWRRLSAGRAGIPADMLSTASSAERTRYNDPRSESQLHGEPMNIAIRTLVCVWLAAAILPLTGADKAPTKAPPKYVLSGSITGMGPTHRAKVTLTSNGKPDRSTTMAADGTFTLKNVLPASYSVRPSHAFYSFSPTFRTVAVTDHDVTVLPFNATIHPSKKK